MLTLFEELLLLSIHQDKGTFIKWSVDRVSPGLAGAALAELALAGKIEAENSHRLHLLDESPTGDEILDEVLDTLTDSDKGRKFGYWINALNQKPEKFRKQITERLIEKKIVSPDDNNLLWVVPSPLNPELEATAKFSLIRDLRGIVLAQQAVEPRKIALLSLIRASDLLGLLFVKDERKLANRHINELVVVVAMKNPLIQTIQEIESAIAFVVEED